MEKNLQPKKDSSLWLWLIVVGVFVPTLLTFFQLGDNPEFYFSGILLAFASATYKLAATVSIPPMQRTICCMAFIMACLWNIDTMFQYAFDVQINYPWWGIIEFSLLFLMFLNSFIQGLTEKTGCFVYVRKPLTFQDLLATIFGGCLVTTATEFQGKFYGFRKGKLIELTDFDKTKYERRNAPIALGEKIVANLGKPWRPWRNCVWIVWR